MRAMGQALFPVAGLALLVYLQLWSAPAQASPIQSLSRRRPEEHVTLSDCRDTADVFSSQMAYFPADPGPEPQDVAVVQTPPGQAALWVNTNTSALFTGTGITFTARLGPKVAEGEFAGMGENDYTTFTCWQRYKAALYKYGNTTCSQVYACNHDAAPGNLPSPANNTVPEPSGTSTPGSHKGGLTQGALVGIVVGAVGGLLFVVASIAVFWFWRRTQKQKKSAAMRPTDDAIFPPHMPLPTGEDVGNVQTVSETRYEMDGRWYRVEMSCEHGKVEMGGNCVQEADEGVVEKELEGECTQKLDEGVKREGSSVRKTVVVGEGPEKENISEGKTDVVSPIADSPNSH